MKTSSRVIGLHRKDIWETVVSRSEATRRIAQSNPGVRPRRRSAASALSPSGCVHTAAPESRPSGGSTGKWHRESLALTGEVWVPDTDRVRRLRIETMADSGAVFTDSAPSAASSRHSGGNSCSQAATLTDTVLRYARV